MNKVVCVNYGTKYPKEYTDRLFNMVKRNTTKPFEFYVLTDQKDLYPDYKVIDITDEQERGWWTKLLMFKPGLLPEGKYLYLDLDVVIVDNIDCLFENESFAILRDFIRPNDGLLPGKEYNSSVMFFDSYACGGIFQFYRDNKQTFQNYQKQIHFFGDQNVISAYLNHFPYFVKPFRDEIIWSYKKGWERGKHAGDRSKYFGQEIPPEGKICVFHGEPNPTEVTDDWVLKNYQ